MNTEIYIILLILLLGLLGTYIWVSKAKKRFRKMEDTILPHVKQKPSDKGYSKNDDGLARAGEWEAEGAMPEEAMPAEEMPMPKPEASPPPVMPMPVPMPMPLPVPQAPPPVSAHIGSILHNLPDHLQAASSKVVRVVIAGQEVPVAVLEQAFANDALAADDEIERKTIKIAGSMRVTLRAEDASKLDIQALTDEEQAIVPNEPTEWQFLVTPKQECNQLLFLSVSRMIKVDGEKSFKSELVYHKMVEIGDEPVEEIDLMPIDTPVARGEIEALLKDGKLGKALEMAVNAPAIVADATLSAEAVLLCSRYSYLSEAMRTDRIKSEEAEVEQNKIVFGLTELLANLPA